MAFSRIEFLLLIVVAAIVEATNTGCQAEFKGKCQCSYNQLHLFVTNCTDSGFDNLDMLTELPITTQALVFTGNHINQVPRQVLGTHNNYTRLRYLDFSHNNIRRISEEAFVGTTGHVEELKLIGNLWELDDQSNIFKHFPQLEMLFLTGAFAPDQDPDEVLRILSQYFGEAEKQMQKLKVLHLENNRFRHLSDDNFFCFLANLEEVYLANNEIIAVHLTPRCIGQLHSLTVLDLSNNHLPYLVNDTLQALSQGKPELNVDLSNNPFVCNCTLNVMLSWLESTDVILRDMESYTCTAIHSEHKSHRYVSDLIGLSLPCLQLEAPTSSHAGYIVLGVILLLLVAISAGLVLINRSTAQRCFRYRTHQPLQTKFEYSTIGGTKDTSEVDV